jgi:tRNA1(Val) A37 N6-methylase TrmN6
VTRDEIRGRFRHVDLGCGRGATSLFLVWRYGVSVVAVDLWIDPAQLAEEARAAGLADRITPLRADAREVPPFPEAHFCRTCSVRPLCTTAEESDHEEPTQEALAIS